MLAQAPAGSALCICDVEAVERRNFLLARAPWRMLFSLLSLGPTVTLSMVVLYLNKALEKYRRPGSHL